MRVIKDITFGSVLVICASTPASAFPVGWIASVRGSGSYTLVDIFVGVASSDKFLNVYNANISTTAIGGFYQAPGMSTKTWKPDTAGFTSSRDSVDSFMTAGTFSGGAYGGQYYASSNSNGDPNFTGTSWNSFPTSLAATTVPSNAGWYTGDPTSTDNRAESLAGLTGRINGDTLAASASFGIWVGHLVLSNQTPATVYWAGNASIKDGNTGGTSDWSRAATFEVPAPGGIALGVSALFVVRRRRR